MTFWPDPSVFMSWRGAAAANQDEHFLLALSPVLQLNQLMIKKNKKKNIQCRKVWTAQFFIYVDKKCGISLGGSRAYGKQTPVVAYPLLWLYTAGTGDMLSQFIRDKHRGAHLDTQLTWSVSFRLLEQAWKRLKGENLPSVLHSELQITQHWK